MHAIFRSMLEWDGGGFLCDRVGVDASGRATDESRGRANCQFRRRARRSRLERRGPPRIAFSKTRLKARNIITLDDEKSGMRIGDAEVVIEATNPRGHVEKKPLLHTQAGGFPDYSELFRFDSSGDYSIRMISTPRPQAKSIETRFTIKHFV
jgi:hypothetical protein